MRLGILFLMGILSTLIFTNCEAANRDSVYFPIGEFSDQFYCFATDPTATVSIDTYSVDVAGFCADGQDPYVTRDGHIAGLPVVYLNYFYFDIQKSPIKQGHVVATVTSGDVSCYEGNGGYEPFRYSEDNYCLAIYKNKYKLK